MLDETLDPEDEILIPIADFVKEWQATDSVAAKLKFERIKGHNHISPPLALGTGIPAEEEWGQQVVQFIAASSNT